MALASLSATPYYRLYTNFLAGGGRAGDFFPHDEFYDGGVRQAVYEVAGRARAGARVAGETPDLCAFYARRAGRPDLACVSLSDPATVSALGAGGFVLLARGRRYFSNDALWSALRRSCSPASRVSLGGVTAIEVYEMDQDSLRCPAAG
ncbi:MAG TPA: hypothetical protein VG148_05375 [Pyrinomonadaceae bacterium]|nr:hypothetical protein [Pyrinomonadaceae bacterium]